MIILCICLLNNVGEKRGVTSQKHNKILTFVFTHIVTLTDVFYSYCFVSKFLGYMDKEYSILLVGI